MVAYSFQAQFADPIRMGGKRQTVRAPRLGRGRHARPGEALQLYTGMRTRQCRLIARATCEEAAPITLVFNDRTYPGDQVWIARGPTIWQGDLDPFAQSDGFKDWAELRAFWRTHHGAIARFEGVIIRWRDMVPA